MSNHYLPFRVTSLYRILSAIDTFLRKKSLNLGIIYQDFFQTEIYILPKFCSYFEDIIV